MIYYFEVTIKDKKEEKKRRFYLTADTDNAFYKRLQQQYSINKNDVKILDRIDDETIDINNKKEETDNISKEQYNKVLEKINGLTETQVEERVNSGKYKRVDLTNLEDDLKKLLKEYGDNKVKIYYLRTGAKKNKKYIALVKEK